jgi:hypothetical protein
MVHLRRRSTRATISTSDTQTSFWSYRRSLQLSKVSTIHGHPATRPTPGAYLGGDGGGSPRTLSRANSGRIAPEPERERERPSLEQRRPAKGEGEQQRNAPDPAPDAACNRSCGPPGWRCIGGRQSPEPRSRSPSTGQRWKATRQDLRGAGATRPPTHMSCCSPLQISLCAKK